MQKLRIQMLLLQENVPTRVEAAQCLFCKKDKLLLALNLSMFDEEQGHSYNLQLTGK